MVVSEALPEVLDRMTALLLPLKAPTCSAWPLRSRSPVPLGVIARKPVPSAVLLPTASTPVLIVVPPE